jgi:hypothetical protein
LGVFIRTVQMTVDRVIPVTHRPSHKNLYVVM